MRARLLCMYNGIKIVRPLDEPAVVASIVLVGALTRSALLHFVWDLKATKMNMKPRLSREKMLNEFELNPNTAETTKNICCVKVNVQLITEQKLMGCNIRLV